MCSFLAVFALSSTLLRPPGEAAESSATKPYRDKVHRVQLDYPADWSLQENESGVTFRSPRGSAIVLRWEEPSGAKGAESEGRVPNRKCSSRSNAYGSEAVVCVDTASFSYRARVVVSPHTELECRFRLTAKGGANGPILEGIVDSVRPFE